MVTSLDRRDLLDALHRDCNDQAPATVDCESAQLVLSLHAGHGPSCQQYLMALSRLSTVMH